MGQFGPRFGTSGSLEEKAVCKSDKIARTPARPTLAAVTPKANKQEQANTKKLKQIRKQQLEEYFGQGP